ncbi:MAG TPA: amino acid adenylation domain-containing protein [Longimicrobiaceae bacterium]|nr:amino acid adenylation domain-containing protein [Longimicrobiaceae bacterium]
MSDLHARLAELSPEKRRLLEMRLRLARGEDAPGAVRPRDPAAGPAPLSYAQERLWLTERLGAGAGVYTMAYALRARGPLDPDALRRALDETVRRHAALRTVFAGGDGAPVQVVLPAAPLPLPVEPVDGEAGADRAAREEAGAPFDLERGPLFRARLLRLAPEEHLLLLALHHAVADGPSLDVLFREVCDLYCAFARGEPSPLAPLPVGYADYAAWQRERVSGAALDEHLAFWREALAGAPTVLDLPTDRPRPPAQSHRGATHRFALPAAAMEGVRALAPAEDATTFMALLAAWQVLLSRYAGEEELVVGTAVTQRTRPELRELVGFFANTLPLRADLSGDPTFRELLSRTRTSVLAAYAHQDAPFDRVVEAVQPGRDPGRSPLVQVMFALRGAHPEPRTTAGVTFSLEERDTGTAKFDLTLEVADEGARPAALLEYATELFDAATVERMAEHLRVLLAGIAADPERRVSDLPLMSAEERRRVVSDWNATGRPFAAGPLVHELVAAQARRRPEAPAVVCGGAVLTYAELDARADALAAELRRRGVGPESRVAVRLERTAEMVVAQLAILKAGAAYLPIDPATPAERVAFMLADAGAVEVTPLPPAPSPARGEGEHTAAGIDSGDEWGRVAAIKPPGGGLAYLIYTSGSTGTPKAVAVTHASLSATLAAAADAFGFGAEDVVSALASPAFDIALFEVLSPLRVGGTALLVPRDLVADPEAVLEAVGDATVLHAVPSLMREVVRVARQRGAPARLRALLVGGDTVAPELVAEMREVFPAARRWVMYGPTEATILCTAYAVPAAGEVVGHPIGVPLGNAALSVRDPRGMPVPTGVPGELWIGGAAVAVGYLGRPELTAEKFVAGPEGRRWYRTGDRARWRGDGVLEFLGRTDRQVKVRGFRIEPGEVEAALREHPAVREAVVGVREDGAGERLLVGWVVGEDAAPEAAELRRWLRERLPEHLVPTAFVALERVPLTAHGKTDHAALPAPEGAGAGAGFVAPRTPTEEVLAEVWCEVLGLERVGARDDFFTLGGHSLRATQVVSRVRERLGVELPLRAVFEASTVEGLALRVVEAAGAAVADAAPLDAAGGDGEADTFPLSFAQQRLWFLDQMAPGNTAYNITGAYHLRGELDAAALEGALDELRRRHESLRTVFAAAADGPVQVVRPWRPEPLPRRELSGASRAEVHAEVDRRVAEVAATPFDLARGPLLRTELLRMGEGEHVLVWGVHHIVSDGWSMGVFDRELRALYEAFAAGEPSPLAELEVQYADYAVWQREYLAGEALEAQLAFWRERLSGAPALELPTDRPRPPVQTFAGAACGWTLPAGLAARLRAVGRTEHATPFMVLLAAWKLLLSRWAGEEDVTVGTPVANRDRREIEGLIGFFVNTLAVRTDLSGRPGFREVVRRVRDGAFAAFAHQEIPFEKVVEELRPERDPSRTPVFQVVFSMQAASDGAAQAGGLEWGTWSGEGHTAKFDLALGMADGPDGLHALLEYNTDLFERDTVERMAAQIGVLLEAVAADPDRPAADVPLLLPSERERLARWSAAGAQPAPARLVHERFAEQAARAPDRTALVHGAERVAYAELDRRSDGLAARLRELGVGPGVRVAVRIERSPSLVAGLLAVLKAGGAYVALDPAEPAERLADSGAAVVVEGGAGAGYEVRITGERPRAPGGPLAPDDLACVVFVRGPGGEPVGLEVPHRAVAEAAAGVPDEGDTLLQHSPVPGAGPLLELWPALLGGGACVLHPGRDPDPAELARQLREHGVTTLSLAPAYFARVVDAHPDALAGVRRVVVTGPASVPHARRALEAGPGLQLSAGWAAAECGGLAVGQPVPRGPDGRALALGRPAGGRIARVLDASMEPVPVGVPGELYVGGAGLARGYAGRPALTAERWLPDPLPEAPGARLFRTGERARWRADGTLEWMGTAGAPVRVRGFRVEPREVEAALAGLPGVRDAAVVARSDSRGVTRLAGYVVPEPGASPEPAALRTLLLERIPEPSVPTALVVVAGLPLAADGGLDAGALPAPDAAGDRDAFVAPRTATEERIAAIWREVLRVERVGVHDRFFDLGGHSLRATQVVTRIREAFSAELPVRALFETPTVAALAARLEAQAGAPEAAAGDGPIVRQSREGRARRAPRRPEG